MGSVFGVIQNQPLLSSYYQPFVSYPVPSISIFSEEKTIYRVSNYHSQLLVS
jgi:hypothetical protein